MKRLALSAGLLGVLAGCDVALESLPLPYSCNPISIDGGERCTAGWSCGFDNRCFDRDGGQAAQSWRCSKDDECPNAWRCGAELEGQRFCQQLNVGAPSPCAVDLDCQAQWRCGHETRCFDPLVLDAGVTRRCDVTGATSQCANGYRCGELVDDVRLCVEIDAGAPSACVSDLGCEGGWRCDTERSRCVLVEDAVSEGHLTSVDGLIISPRLRRPVPLKLAMTRVFYVPNDAFNGGRVQNHNVRGGVTAALFDGGLWVTAQATDDGEVTPIAGGQQQLFSRWVPLPAGTKASDVTDLVISGEGPAVRFADAGAMLFVYDGGSYVANTPYRMIRPSDSFEPYLQQLFLVSEGPALPDGGLQDLVELAQGRDWLVPGKVLEVLSVRQQIYAVTTAGTFRWDVGGPDGGFTSLSGPVPDFEVVAAAAGKMLEDDRLGIQLLVKRPDAGVGLFPLLPEGGNEQLFMANAGLDALDACPAPVAGSVPPSQAVQLAYSTDTQSDRAGAVLRCQMSDGGTFGVTVRYDIRGPQSVSVRFQSSAEDSVPFVRPAVMQTSSAFVRAHASVNGHAWQVVDTGSNGDPKFGLSLLGGQTLRSVILDRQPDTMVTLDDGRQIRTYALAGGGLFMLDDNAGLVSNFNGAGSVSPLGLVTNRSSWVITTGGVFSVASATNGEPTLFATLPAGVSFAAPVSAVHKILHVNGVRREVLVVASGDTLWAADVTESANSTFASPTRFGPIFVPTPGIRIRSLALENSADPDLLSGYLTTNTQTLRFRTNDLIRWVLTTVAAPPGSDLPIEVWSEDQVARVGTADGRVWSLPIMVELTRTLPTGSGSVSDYARKCGTLFSASRGGVFRAAASDGGLPAWQALSSVNALLTGTDSLRLYETNAISEQLHVATQGGQIVELAPTDPCGFDGGVH